MRLPHDKLYAMENKTTPAKEADNKRRVSFSQFQNWYNCRHRWYLDFVKGLRTFEDSITTCFGTAIHKAVQLYIETLYKKSAKEADEHDLYEKFVESFNRELQDHKIVFEDSDYKEYCEDGDNILKAFTNTTNRIKHFPSGKYELIGIEDEIIMPIKHNVEFICYIDVVLKEKATGRYRIIDIKTSSTGWNHYQKDNPSKTAQILLYKAFFSRKYNVPIDMIDVEFFILRRKLWENYDYPQSRIQTFVPRNNQKAVAETLNVFAQFIGECFNPDGTFVENPKGYLKNPGKGKKNCKYCPHKGTNCDQVSDIDNSEL